MWVVAQFNCCHPFGRLRAGSGQALSATKDLLFRGKLVPITISGGSAELGEKDTPEILFERADAALYEAKKAGWNQCVFKPAADE